MVASAGHRNKTIYTAALLVAQGKGLIRITYFISRNKQPKSALITVDINCTHKWYSFQDVGNIEEGVEDAQEVPKWLFEEQLCKETLGKAPKDLKGKNFMTMHGIYGL